MPSRGRAFRAALTLARFGLAEALHSRMAVAALLVALAGVLLVQFAGQLALADSAGIRVATLAWLYRLAAAFLIAGFTVASVVREQDEKVMELVLSLPIPRGAYLAGKALGATTAACALACLFALPLLPDAPAPAVAVWGLTLALELALVALASLLCVLTLGHVVPSLAAVAGFYTLSRTLDALLAIGASPVAPLDSASFQVATTVLHAIATLLPRLDQFARTAWLTGDAQAAADLGAALLQTAVYAPLLACAAYIDLARRSV